MKVHSIFNSIDGEVNSYGQGTPSTFIRLSGCNCNCIYCDIPEARIQGKELSVEEVYEEIKTLRMKKITITGGEPLLQAEELQDLIHLLLLKNNRYVTIETNGTFNPYSLLPKSDRVSYIMDFKMPGSGEYNKMHFDNFKSLRKDDWIKFVVSDEKDLQYALQSSSYLIALSNAKSAISQTWDWFIQDQSFLANYLIDNKIHWLTLNIQLHKLLDMA